MKVGDAEELFQLHPGNRVRVVLRLTLGRGPLGQLTGDFPVEGTLRREQASQVAEQVLKGTTTAEWTGLAHKGMVGR